MVEVFSAHIQRTVLCWPSTLQHQVGMKSIPWGKEGVTLQNILPDYCSPPLVLHSTYWVKKLTYLISHRKLSLLFPLPVSRHAFFMPAVCGIISYVLAAWQNVKCVTAECHKCPSLQAEYCVGWQGHLLQDHLLDRLGWFSLCNLAQLTAMEVIYLSISQMEEVVIFQFNT